MWLLKFNLCFWNSTEKYLRPKIEYTPVKRTHLCYHQMHLPHHTKNGHKNICQPHEYWNNIGQSKQWHNWRIHQILSIRKNLYNTVKKHISILTKKSIRGVTWSHCIPVVVQHHATHHFHQWNCCCQEIDHWHSKFQSTRGNLLPSERVTQKNIPWDNILNG